MAVSDVRSPLSGAPAGDIAIEDGTMSLKSDPSKHETYAALMARQGKEEVEAEADAKPGEEQKRFSMYAFGAQFAEVHVDADLGQVRVSRMVGAFAAGKILNPKTARSQLMGGMIWGLGMALLERTIYDPHYGRIVNANLAEYLVPVNRDAPQIDVITVAEDDPHVNPLGVKGIGEIGITGAAAAIVNAVYHATGKRVRELPVTLDKLL
jgi:xanthine dehydrogenase YagR molybdenum-binding subunit